MGKSLLALASFVTFAATTVAAAPPQKAIVFTQIAKSADIADQLTYPARIESKVNAKLIAEADGVVTEIKSPLGENVKRNGTVLLIKNMEPGYSYAPHRVTSPVAGVVSAIKVTVGTQVSRGLELGAVTDPSALKIAIEVSASDIGSFHRGLKGELVVSGADKPVVVEALGVSPFVDPATGTATAELKIVDNRKQPIKLSPGLIGQVRFKVNSRKGFTLPDHAIVYKGDLTQVRLVVGNKAKITAVKLGRKRQGIVEVLSGIKEGDQVIERTSTFVGDGDEVEVKKPETQGKAKS